MLEAYREALDTRARTSNKCIIVEIRIPPNPVPIAPATEKVTTPTRPPNGGNRGRGAAVQELLVEPLLADALRLLRERKWCHQCRRYCEVQPVGGHKELLETDLVVWARCIVCVPCSCRL